MWVCVQARQRSRLSVFSFHICICIKLPSNPCPTRSLNPQVQEIMRVVAGQQQGAPARAGPPPTCDTEAVLSACSKAFEIIHVGPYR